MGGRKSHQHPSAGSAPIRQCTASFPAWVPPLPSLNDRLWSEVWAEINPTHSQKRRIRSFVWLKPRNKCDFITSKYDVSWVSRCNFPQTLVYLHYRELWLHLQCYLRKLERGTREFEDQSSESQNHRHARLAWWPVHNSRFRWSRQGISQSKLASDSNRISKLWVYYDTLLQRIKGKSNWR